MAADLWHRHLRQGGMFLLVGLAQLAVDTGIFIGITAVGMPVVAGNLLGRVSGAALGFWLNGRYTFGQQTLDRRHALRFALVWVLLTCLSTVLISLVASQVGLHSAWMAKPIVEGGVAVVSFLLWKYFIFR